MKKLLLVFGLLSIFSPLKAHAFAECDGWDTRGHICSVWSTGFAYDGTTLDRVAFPIFKSATVSSGTAVVNLTDDGTSTGNPLCVDQDNNPTVIANSVNVIISDATAIYPVSWAFSGTGNRTLTVTVNKASATGVITLLGLNLLGAPVTAANGTTAKITVWCYQGMVPDDPQM